MHQHLKQAGKVAIPKHDNDMREFWIGCVGVRSDGAVVQSPNAPARIPPNENNRFPPAHAEARVCRKMDAGGVLYVTRVHRNGAGYGMAKPCRACMRVIKSRGIKRVYYTIKNGEWGTIDLTSNKEWKTKKPIKKKAKS